MNVPPEGTVLYDPESGEAYFEIVDVDRAGVTIRRRGVETFLPSVLFERWNQRLATAGDLDRPKHAGRID